MSAQQPVGLHQADIGDRERIEAPAIEKKEISRPRADAFDRQKLGARRLCLARRLSRCPQRLEFFSL